MSRLMQSWIIILYGCFAFGRAEFDMVIQRAFQHVAQCNVSITDMAQRNLLLPDAYDYFKVFEEGHSSSLYLVKGYEFPSGLEVKFECKKGHSIREAMSYICSDGDLRLPVCLQDTCLVPVTSLAMNNLVVPPSNQQYEEIQWFDSRTSPQLYKGYRLPMSKDMTFDCAISHIQESPLVARCQSGPMDLPLCKPVNCFVSDEQLIESNVFLSHMYKKYHTKQVVLSRPTVLLPFIS
uniref:uncharacterized protein n=1 Tax=Myxine glutinosa TaxID=7769 RepID=UPI00358E7DD8